MMSLSASATARKAQTVFSSPCRGRGVFKSVRGCVPNRKRSVSAAEGVETADTAFVNSASGVKPFEDIPGPTNLPGIGTLWQYKLGKYPFSPEAQFKKHDFIRSALKSPVEMNARQGANITGLLSVLDYHKSLSKLHEKYGSVCRQNLANNEIVHVFDPEDIRTYYKLEGHSPYIKPLQESVQFYRRGQNIAPGLGNVNGQEWLVLRAAVRQLMLRPKEVATFLPLTEKAASALVETLDHVRGKDGSVPNLKDIVGKWIQESAGYVAFDRSLGCFAGGKSEETAQKVLDANGTIFLLAGLLHFSLPIYEYISTPKFRRLIEAENFFNETTNAYVKEVFDEVTSLINKGELGEKYPFMAYLLSRTEISLPDTIQTIQSLLSDGLTSSRPIYMSCLHNLATNPEAQEKAYREVQEVVGDAKVVTSQMLGRLSYIKAVIKETFRINPVGTEISRVVQRDMVLSNYKIPKNTHLNICPIVHLRNEKYFPDPDKFSPERWLRGQDNNIHPFIVIPFGHGPRACIGRRFAEQDLQVGLAKTLQRFELRHADNKPLEFQYHTLLTHKHPVRVQFFPRS